MFTKYNSKHTYCDKLFKKGNTIFMNYITRMRNLREDHDLTQQKVADYLGTSQTMYARYERGANELPIRHLISLCRLYQVSADYLLGLSSYKTPLT
jgi:transcriptional regulator with XRE-family HTH domain